MTTTSERLVETVAKVRADMAAKAEQQRKTAALAALDGMDMAHRAETWERDLDAGKAWAYAGARVDGVIARARALLAGKDPWETAPIRKADLAELVRRAEGGR